MNMQQFLEKGWLTNVAYTDIFGLQSKKQVEERIDKSDRVGLKYHFIQKYNHSFRRVYAHSKAGALLALLIEDVLGKSAHGVFIYVLEDGFYMAVIDTGRVTQDCAIDFKTDRVNPLRSQIVNHFVKNSPINCSFYTNKPIEAHAIALNLNIDTNITEFKQVSLSLASVPLNDEWQLVTKSDVKPPMDLIKTATLLLGLLFVVVIAVSTLIPEETTQPTKSIDPYKQLVVKQTNTGTNIKFQLARLHFDITELQQLMNWQVTKILSKKELTIINIIPIGQPNLAQLKQWVAEKRYQYKQVKGLFSILIPLKNSPPLTEAILPPIGDEVAYIRTALERWWPNAKLTELNAKTFNKSKWVETVLKVSFDDWNHFDLDTLGSLLATRSLSFNEAYLDKKETDTFQGHVEFVVFGTP